MSIQEVNGKFYVIESDGRYFRLRWVFKTIEEARAKLDELLAKRDEEDEEVKE